MVTKWQRSEALVICFGELDWHRLTCIMHALFQRTFTTHQIHTWARSPQEQGFRLFPDELCGFAGGTASIVSTKHSDTAAFNTAPTT